MSSSEYEERLLSSERTQAQHEQVLSTLISSVEKLDRKLDRQNDDIAALRTQKPPYANMIAFTSVLVTILMAIGWLGTEPTRIAIEYLIKEQARDREQFSEDNIRERVDAGKFSELSSEVKALKALNNNLHEQKDRRITRIEGLVFKPDWKQ